MSLRAVISGLLVTAASLCASATIAQDEELPVEGGLVDFVRDVKPIFDEKCLSCHGPDDAKNDFRIDDSEYVLSYLEPGDLESSSMWADYIVTDDPDMRMPPPDGEHVLTGPELATIRLWIEEGCEWPEEIPEDSAEEEQPEPALPQSTAAKVWILQGLFHPASVHFPIALLTVSAGFVLLSFINRDAFEPVAFHCLWIGTLGAIAACVMGWAYAQHEGYGAGFSFDLGGSAIDRHRWLGILVAVGGCILFPLARSVRRNNETGKRLIWLVGSVLVVGGVSITGYQGGELTYGEDHYLKEYQRLFPESAVTETETGEDPEGVVAGESADGAESEATEADDATTVADESSAASSDNPTATDETVDADGSTTNESDDGDTQGEGSQPDGEDEQKQSSGDEDAGNGKETAEKQTNGEDQS